MRGLSIELLDCRWLLLRECSIHPQLLLLLQSRYFQFQHLMGQNKERLLQPYHLQKCVLLPRSTDQIQVQRHAPCG